jgi:hypothetical protein
MAARKTIQAGMIDPVVLITNLKASSELAAAVPLLIAVVQLV